MHGVHNLAPMHPSDFITSINSLDFVNLGPDSQLVCKAPLPASGDEWDDDAIVVEVVGVADQTLWADYVLILG